MQVIFISIYAAQLWLNDREVKHKPWSASVTAPSCRTQPAEFDYQQHQRTVGLHTPLLAPTGNNSVLMKTSKLSFSHSVTLTMITYLQGGPIKTAHFLRYHIFAATTDVITRFLMKCSEITAENNKRQFFKPVLNILCKLVKIWYLVNVSETDSNNISSEVCHRVLSQSVYALLSLIQAMLNMSTLSTNDQGKSFWELVYGSVNLVIIQQSCMT